MPSKTFPFLMTSASAGIILVTAPGGAVTIVGTGPMVQALCIMAILTTTKIRRIKVHSSQIPLTGSPILKRASLPFWTTAWKVYR